MAYRELHVVEVRECLRLWSRGRGFRPIAGHLSLDRKTVRRYVEAAQTFGFERSVGGSDISDELVSYVVAAVTPGGARDPGKSRALCREHAERIEKWFNDGCNGPKVVELLARHTGVRVPLRTLQRFAAEELGRDGRNCRTVRVVDPPPGQVLEIDFFEAGELDDIVSGQRRKLHALLCTAGYSRHQFVWPCLSQTRDDVIAGLEAAWAFFEGVFWLSSATTSARSSRLPTRWRRRSMRASSSTPSRAVSKSTRRVCADPVTRRRSNGRYALLATTGSAVSGFAISTRRASRRGAGVWSGRGCGRTAPREVIAEATPQEARGG